MAMNPRTHPRGAAPDFTLPRPNPNPARITDAVWWLACMRLLLEPGSRNGGTYADKPGSHNIGSALPDYGRGDRRTDHSIRDTANRSGPWWRSKTAAHDWTFVDAQRGNFATISKYTRRAINARRDPKDPRPDDVYFYVLGQIDNDRVVEGYNERDDQSQTSRDLTHLWHRHDSFWRNIVGSFPHMWAVLTIDMGWTVAEWRQSLEDDVELDDTIKLITNGAVDYTNPTTTVEGVLASTNYYVLQSRNAILTELNRAELRESAILAALTDGNETNVLAAVNARADELGGQLSGLGAGVTDVLSDADRSADEVASALRAALGDRTEEVARLLLADSGSGETRDEASGP